MKKDQKQKKKRVVYPDTKLGHLRKNVHRVQTGSKAYKFTKEKIYPWLLIAFAAFAYGVYDIEIPKEKKKKKKK